MLDNADAPITEKSRGKSDNAAPRKGLPGRDLISLS